MSTIIMIINKIYCMNNSYNNYFIMMYKNIYNKSYDIKTK